jgi:hypothetical protein
MNIQSGTAISTAGERCFFLLRVESGRDASMFQEVFISFGRFLKSVNN